VSSGAATIVGHRHIYEGTGPEVAGGNIPRMRKSLKYAKIAVMHARQ
jgi:hypothetical protein